MAFHTTTNTFTTDNNNKGPPPPTVSLGTDEAIHYWLFPHHPDGSRVTQRSQLEALVDKLMANVAQYTHSYIWHHHAFALRVCGCDEEEEEEEEKNQRKRRQLHEEEEEGQGALGPHLAGSTCVGDYLEDEWFITYLLLTLTKDFPGLVCRGTFKKHGPRSYRVN
ncbi:protein ecdysoneless-like [Eriocheir sinensis]|uniref:protein ecdysoneless-like n=1 Tax=Eriocheir sinensis TaxID=95602 RepID=UPI0021C70550|nr:protein ecdysoneless-like [Eriocheir sinensis]